MVFVLAFVPLALTAASSGIESAADRRCEAATAYAERILDAKHKRPPIFATVPLGEADDLPRRPRWFDPETGDPGSAPSAALMVRLSRDRGANAVASCADIRTMLTDRHIAFGDEAIERATGPAQQAALEYDGDVIGVSLPVVSADGAEALLVTSVASGPVAGVVRLDYLRRSESGPWRLVSRAILTIA